MKLFQGSRPCRTAEETSAAICPAALQTFVASEDKKVPLLGGVWR